MAKLPGNEQLCDPHGRPLRTLADINGLGKLDIQADEKALKFLAVMSDGDARRALNALEIGSLTTWGSMIINGSDPKEKGGIPV